MGSIIVALAAAWASARKVCGNARTSLRNAVEFRIGDYQHELGIIDSQFAAHGRPDTAGGAVVYWHVDDVRASVERLVSMGATVHEELVERGPGFVTASVIDPFGNILGVMHNRHYLEILASRAGGVM